MVESRGEAKEKPLSFFHTTRVITVTKLLYPEIFSNHNYYKYSMDNNNIRLMFYIFLEEKIRTHRWEIGCFSSSFE